MNRSGVILFLCLFLSALGCHEAVWVGHYPLKLSIQTENPDDLSDLKYAAFWTRKQADEAFKLRSGPEIEFHPLALKNGESVIDVRTSGRKSSQGQEREYVQEKFLLIEYGLPDKTSQNRPCVRLEIPDGRETRDVSISLP